MNSEKVKVFVSYSRADLPFPRNLQQRLVDCGYDVFLDLHDIAKGENWKQRLNGMLLESDVVVFVISDNWLASETCAWELQRVLDMGKRMAPLIHGPLNSTPPPRLAELNWTFSDELGPESDVTLRGSTRPELPTEHVIKALCTNLDHDTAWLREHSRWLARASEWQEAEKVDDKLLRYGEIFSARQWAKLQPPNTPSLPEGMLEFFDASETFEIAQRNRLLTLTQKGFLGPAQRAVELNYYEAGLRLIATAAILGEDPQLKRVARFRELLSQVAWNLSLEGTIPDAKWYDFIDAQHLIFTNTENTLHYLSIEDWAIHEIAALSVHENLSVVDVLAVAGEAVYVDRDGDVHRFTVALGSELLFSSQSNSQTFVAVRFLGDKGYALIADDGAIALADRGADTSIRQWLGAPDLPEINRVISSSDGTRLLTETHYIFDETPVRVWDTETGDLLDSVTDQWKAEFAPNGQFITAQDAYESISEIKTVDQDQTDLLTHEKGTFDPKFSPCSRWVVTVSRDHCVRLWKTENGECIWQSDGTGGMPADVCFSSDSQQLIVGDEDGVITIYQIPTGVILQEIPNPLVSIQSVKCEVNSDLLASRSTDGAVRIYRPSGTELKFLVPPSSELAESRLSEAGGVFVKIDSAVSTGIVYSVLSGAEMFRFTVEAGRLTDIAISPCERYIATLADNGALSLYSIPECGRISQASLEFEGTPSLGFSQQGSYLLVTCNESHETYVYTTQVSDGELKKLPTIPGTNWVFSENEDRCIAITGPAGNLRLCEYSTETWNETLYIDLGDVQVSHMSLIHGGTAVALGVNQDGDYGLQVWCLQTREKRLSFGEGLEAAVRSIISIDTDRLIFTDQNGVTRLLNCQSLACSTIDKFDFVGQKLVPLEIAGLVLVHGSDYVNSYGEDWIREGHSQIRLLDYNQRCCLQTWQQDNAFNSMALCGWANNVVAASTRAGGLALIDFRHRKSPTIDSEALLKNLLSRGRQQVTKTEQEDFLMSGAPTSLALTSEDEALS